MSCIYILTEYIVYFNFDWGSDEVQGERALAGMKGLRGKGVKVDLRGLLTMR